MSARINWFEHPESLKLRPEMKSILHKYGAEGYGMAILLIEVILKELDSVIMIHENNETALMIDMCCRDINHMNEMLEYFQYVGLISIEKSMGYTFIGCQTLAELRKRQDAYRKKDAKQSQSYRVRIAVLEGRGTKNQIKHIRKGSESTKKQKLGVLLKMVDTQVSLQHRVSKRFPGINPLKAIFYFVDKVITSENEFEYYFREMTKQNFERFFVSWLKFYIESNGITSDISGDLTPEAR